MLRPLGLALALAASATAFAGPPALTLSVDNPTPKAGDVPVFHITGAPGVLPVLLGSATLGPISFPGIGTLDIGVPFLTLGFPIIDSTGSLFVDCPLPCTQLSETPFTVYLQAIGFDTNIAWAPIVGKSNVATLTYDPATFRDCNGNGIQDSCDIMDGTSLDVDQNGDPDECVDCDGNGQPDGPNVSGSVWHDLNNNGVRDANDPGVADVIVTAYDLQDNVITGTMTAADGRYTLDNAADANGIRVEFTDIPGWLTVAPAANGTGKETQFVSGQTCEADLGLIAPAELCPEGDNACLVTACYVNGDPLAGGTAGDLDVLVRVPYSASGSGQNTYLADGKDMGSVWGLAHHRSTDTLYSAAFLKRHVGFGPGGSGAIYATADACAATPGASSVWLDVNTFAGVDAGSVVRTDLPASITLPSYDLDAYANVGKVGLGGITISEDERTLYVVNLNQREVLEIDIDTKALLNRYPVDTGIVCTDGVARPFAVTFFRGSLYVGVTCTGETNLQSGIIEARVRRLESGVFQDVLAFPLDYNRAQPYVVCAFTGWFPWIPGTVFQGCGGGVAVFPQPILSDLAFDNDGCLTLGFIDRFGHQTGFNNYSLAGPALFDGFSGGDMLRACPENGSLALEQNGSAGGVTTAGAGNAQGPGGGEYFYSDDWSVNGNVSHHEVTLGGVAVLPGSGEVVATAFDPINNSPTEIRTGGMRWFDSATGAVADAYKVYQMDAPGTFGKAAGLGDLEILCSALPIEIGDRVFVDANDDGRQQAGEAGLSSITVELYRGGQMVDQTSTGADGSYSFSGLIANDPSYEVRIALNQPALSGFAPATANAGGNDLSDSDGDASLVAGSVTAPVPALAPGRTDFTIDFGFVGP